jgi:SagB-type dehydrogenase family enzyme
LTQLARHPDLLLCWSKGRLLAKNLETGTTVLGGAEIAAILGLFDRPSSLRAAAKRLTVYAPESIRRWIDELRRIGFLIPEKDARRRVSRLAAWNQNLASAHYHVASRDLKYLNTPLAIDEFVRSYIEVRRRPPSSKRYPTVVRRRLAAHLGEGAGADLERTLLARRTVRKFRRATVPLEDFARIVRGTWGRTGTIDGGLLGPLMTKTSPSGGALHPIECYVMAWNVGGLPAGLYHYDVRADELRLLKRGDLRAAAVRAASGQRWVGRAAFLCIMTAVFERTLWKYQLENAYRVLWLDAGHLAQTFCLLATARGLGPFTTAAIQDSYIEKLIGLDGIKEFPVYLCGAGVPAKKR